MKFQSTHPRGVRLCRACCGHVAAGVSIHAPAWGATRFTIPKTNAPEVSIHAPAWGATSRKRRSLTSELFQSTHPRGVRHDAIQYVAGYVTSFNPRTRVGCDGHGRR